MPKIPFIWSLVSTCLCSKKDLQSRPLSLFLNIFAPGCSVIPLYFYHSTQRNVGSQQGLGVINGKWLGLWLVGMQVFINWKKAYKVGNKVRISKHSILYWMRRNIPKTAAPGVRINPIINNYIHHFRLTHLKCAARTRYVREMSNHKSNHNKSGHKQTGQKHISVDFWTRATRCI